MEVISIDGQNALQVILEFANKTVGTSKDVGTRFNLALIGLLEIRAF
jgi:hypothetical protein